ncbi:hypothetical protein BD410DRAFT_894021 [Rickenella mellea]|uniref:Uncharacterized protein n=1 Tax=Rickenella mellea TaxID=50990 RepID=A0A4Y7QLY4_9AGAM|nr:hypothetical protein BD410DRAFT_894021 [Rickenella mellea]
MSPVFRPILPKIQTASSNDNTGNGLPSTVQPIVPKNPTPCANCSSAQQACFTHPPYSPSLCKKCAREHRDKCPAHMNRIEARQWKKQDTELRLAADAQAVPTAQVPVLMEDPLPKGNVNVVFAPPEITPAATVQLEEDVETHTDGIFEPNVSSFVEDFAFPPFTANDPTLTQHHDEVEFNFNALDQEFDSTIMFTMVDNFQDLFNPTEDDLHHLDTVFDAVWDALE